MPIRVMVVEDRADFRRMLATLLDPQNDLEVVAQAGSLRTACDHLAGAALGVMVGPDRRDTRRQGRRRRGAARPPVPAAVPAYR